MKVSEKYRVYKDQYGYWWPQYRDHIGFDNNDEPVYVWKIINKDDYVVYTYKEAISWVNAEVAREEYNENPVVLYPPFPEEEPK
jgi:hypothetical protein